MWLVQIFWKLLGIFDLDFSFNKFQYVYSILLMATCIHNFITITKISCTIDQWCIIFSSSMLGLYSRILASITFLSRIAIIVQSKNNLLKYKATIKAFENYSPTSPLKLRNYKIFSITIAILCLILNIPMHINKLYFLYYYMIPYDNDLFIFHLFSYIQNLSMYCVEMQFVTQCFMIYTKFQEINNDLKKLKDENINHWKYSFIMNISTNAWNDYNKSLQCLRHDKNFYRPWFKSHPIANTIEMLRIKHWLTRQAVDVINNLFGIHMGLSIFLLWVLALFEIYYMIYQSLESKIMIYGWLLQLILRFFMIILAAHSTTKQAMKSKLLIADTNNQMLDSNIKEELLLFMNQIHNHPIEFTVYDFFTLNTQVIKSAIAAGTTYLVILVQFH